MEIAAGPEPGEDGVPWILLRVNPNEIKALEEALKKFTQDAHRSKTEEELNTARMNLMLPVIHKARSLLNPS